MHFSHSYTRLYMSVISSICLYNILYFFTLTYLMYLRLSVKQDTRFIVRYLD